MKSSKLIGTEHTVYSSKPTKAEELKSGYGYFWWLPDCVKPEESRKDDWVIIYWDINDKNRNVSGHLIGPIQNEYFSKKDKNNE